MRKRLTMLLAGLGMLLLPATAAGNAVTSADGSRVVFDTTEKLLPRDDRSGKDVYELVNGKTLRLLTPDNPTLGPLKDPVSMARAISRDGKRVLIETFQSYSPHDNDSSLDHYVFEDGAWYLVTVGPSPGNGLDSFRTLGYSADLRYIYFDPFRTALVSSDVDNDRDIYEWSGAHGVRMVSTGPTENTTPMPSNLGYLVEFGGATDDGSRVVFTSGDELTADAHPGNGVDDGHIYLRDNGTTTTYLPVPGPAPSGRSPRTMAAGISPDGSRVYLDTNLHVEAGDNDLGSDVYARDSAGNFTRVSTGPIGGNGTGPGCDQNPYNYAECSASYLSASRSGDRVFFTTEERLTTDDTDLGGDIYERHGSTTSLITPNTPVTVWSLRSVWAPHFLGVSDDGTQVAFSTKSSLVPADRDERLDIYVRMGGQYHLISTGPAGERSKYEPEFADFVDGGGNVVFFTRAPLVPTDNDDEVDIYQRILFNPKPAPAVTAGKSKKKRKKGKATGKTRLVSAERIPPSIGLSRRGRVSNGTAQVRISCPKKESSGGCKGSVKVLGGGKGGFRLKRGRSAWVAVGSAGSVGNAATVVVRGKDLLGNKAKVRKRVSF
jgi:hypothetical protein